MKKTILVNASSDVIMKGMNEKVRNKVNIKDKLGMTDFYFWGEEITQNVFVLDSARHVNNFLRIKGEMIEQDQEHTEICVKVINRLSYYVIYVLAVWFLVLALLSKEMFLAVFAVVFVGVAWITKCQYLNDVIEDLNHILKDLENN